MHRVLFCVLLGALSCNGASIPDLCDAQNDGALVASPVDCEKFVVCVAQRIFSVRSCASGLHFNARLRVCDLPRNAGCKGTLPKPKYTMASDTFEAVEESTGPSGTTCNKKGVCEDQKDGTLFPNPSTNGYIVCQCECEIAMPCPDGLVFNSIVKACDWPDKPNTPATPPDTPATPPDTPATPPDTPATPPDTPATPPDTPDTPPDTPATPPDTPATPPDTPATPPDTPATPPDTPSCPPDTPDTPPDTPATPPDTPATPPDTPSTPGVPSTGPSGTTCNIKGVCEGQKDGTMFSNPSTNGYIVCQCECEIAMPCPDGLVFNPTLKVCDWSDRNSTSEGPSSGPSGTTCNNKGVCEGQKDGSMFPNPSTNGYIVCQCECEIPMPCPDGLVFNSILKVCDWPDMPDTPATPPDTPDTPPDTPDTPPDTPATPPDTPETPPDTPDTPPDTPVTPPDTPSCPPDTPDTPPDTPATPPDTPATPPDTPDTPPDTPVTPPDTPDTPPDTPSTPGVPSTGPSGTTCNIKGVCEGQKDGTMFSNPSTNGYIVCQCECEIAMPCPDGLVFNPILKVCDWPHSV